MILMTAICALISACGEDEGNSRLGEETSSGELSMGGEVPATAGEGDSTSQIGGDERGGETPSSSSGESAGDSIEDPTEDGIWVTKPPADEGGERAAIWIDADLSNFGLTDPDDAQDSTPLGEAPCAYQPPSFTLSHPREQMGAGRDAPGRDASEVWERSGAWELRAERPSAYHLPPARVAQLEPAQGARAARIEEKPDLEGVVLPTHVNTMPLSERALGWDQPRCYELGPFDDRLFEPQQGGVLLSEEDAYEMYVRLVRTTLWREVDQTEGKRTVIGLRGAYPGSLRWHHNAPNQFNDTIVLLWRDAEGVHVREYPVNTDTGRYDFGADNSSSLRPNRHYPYINGWHRDYHALQIDLPGYPVRDDTNNNGHWDSDRNGWLEGPESGQDYDRLGTAHNIHAGNIDAPLRDALVNIASAGCQVIPGMENWLSFMSYAWTGLGDEVDYYLIDARDISPRFWSDCAEGDGSHACPHLVTRFPYQHQSETRTSDERWHDVYSCDDADESGAERVYVLNLPSSGRLRVSITEEGEGVDPDLHLLEGDDSRACRARGHREIQSWTPAGRYLIVVDTWVNASGVELAGGYTLNVEWSPED